MNPLAINAIGEELEISAAFCRSERIGLEMSDFAFPQKLDDGLPERVRKHKEAATGIAPLIIHGPFFELAVASLDQEIVAVARKRHETVLAIAAEIGATYYIAHTNYNPLIRESSYRANWTKRSLDFWLPLADRAAQSNIKICLENVWEPSPDIQAGLITAANHPSLKATFDNGHALIDSKFSASQWIATLGPILAHCHLHDNGGKVDEHKPVGEGIENWKELVRAIRKHAPGAVLVTETGGYLSYNRPSLERLRLFLNAS